MNPYILSVIAAANRDSQFAIRDSIRDAGFGMRNADQGLGIMDSIFSDALFQRTG
jgi:hypothetical protein